MLLIKILERSTNIYYYYNPSILNFEVLMIGASKRKVLLVFRYPNQKNSKVKRVWL